MLFIKRVNDIVKYNIKKVVKGTSAELKPYEKTNDVISNKKSLKSINELPKILYPPKPILLEKNYNKIIDSENVKLSIDYKNLNRNEKSIIVFFMIIFLFISINLYRTYHDNVRYILTHGKVPRSPGSLFPSCCSCSCSCSSHV